MAERAFCKAYLDLKAEAAKANELDALEKQIGKLKGEARRYEELGGGREADNQSVVLPRKSRSRQQYNCGKFSLYLLRPRTSLSP